MADLEPDKRTKRRLRSTETVRERAEKAQSDATKPSRRSLIQSSATAAAGKPARGIAKLFRYQPFRFIWKILRFVGRFFLFRYIRNSWRELRLVTWPTRTQTRQLTFAVLLFAIIFGALVSIVDYGLDKVFKQVLLK